MAATDGYYSVGSGKIQWKIFWKGYVVLDIIKNIHDSWEAVKILNITAVWKISTILNDFQGFKPLVEKVTADMVEVQNLMTKL
jgi:hypothetical protein